MCVSMAVESVEVKDSSDLSGKERHTRGEIIRVYTRKNRKAKLHDVSAAAVDGPAVSADSANSGPSLSSSPAKNHVFRDNHVPRQAGGEALEGQDGNFLEQQPLVVGLKGEDSSLVRDEGVGGEEAVLDGVAETLPSGGEEIEERTKSSCGEEPVEQLHTSYQQANCNTGPQLGMSARQEPVIGGNFLDHQPNSGGEFQSDDRAELLSNYVQEMESNHGNDQALESSCREELQPSTCRAYALSSTEELKQLTNARGDLQRSGGQVKLPSGVLGPHPCGHDGHENHLALNCLSKPLISRAENRVLIALSGSNSKDEIRSLKRKLEVQLDQVRRVMRKVNDKELQVAAYNARNMANPAGYRGSGVGNFNVYNGLHLTKIGSSVDSVGIPESRSFRHLNVPEMENNQEGAEYAEKEMRTPRVCDQPHLTRVDSSVCPVRHLETRPFRNLNVSAMESNNEAGDFVDREKRTPKANPFYISSDFYLEKDRLPPESHKKMLKGPVTGKKHGVGGEYTFAFAFGTDKDGNKLFRDCSNLLQRLMKHKHGWVFNSPVDPIKLGIPDYHDIIKHPMDLGTIKTRLAQKWYKSALEFAEDVRLVFCNAMTYNPKGHDVHTMAEELSTLFEDRWASIQRGYFQKKMSNKAGYFPARRKGYQPPPLFAPVTVPSPARFTPPTRTLDTSDYIMMPVNSIVRPANSNIPHVGRTPALQKPKAKDPNKRDMTCDEKQKLSTKLQSLPSEKLDAIVQIIKKRSTALNQHDDEIEVDIDSVDAETLWELDRFVSNYRKSLSKYKRKAELAQQARAAAAQAILTTDVVPAALDSQKESTTGGGNVSSTPLQVESQAKGTASSSSSSSSSDSGSSSSDSDSDSSSADG